jgi:hypothetical protein
MSKKLAVLTVVLVLGTLTAPGSASAKTFFTYLTNGFPLAGGATREVSLDESGMGFSAKWTFKQVMGNFEAECQKMSVVKGGFIAGGTPGTSFMKLKWSECAGTSKGNKCTSVAVESSSLRGELVEEVTIGLVATEMAPLEGEKLIIFSVICGGIGEERVAKGGLFANPSSYCGNKAIVGFDGEAGVKAVKTFLGVERNVSPTMEGKNMMIEGATPLKLTAGGNWGVC